MSVRTTLPSNLTTPTLARSGEGVTYRQPTPAVVQATPILPVATATPARVLPPSVVQQPAVEVTASASPPGPVMQPKEDWGFSINPAMVVILILIFVVVFIILFITEANMVTDLVNGKRVRNNSKLIFWTFLIAVVLAVLAFVIAALVQRRGRRMKA